MRGAAWTAPRSEVDLLGARYVRRGRIDDDPACTAGRRCTDECTAGEGDAEHAKTKAALDDSRNENAKTQAELNVTRKKLGNFKKLLWVGVPAVIVLLVLAFYFAR